MTIQAEDFQVLRKKIAVWMIIDEDQQLRVWELDPFQLSALEDAFNQGDILKNPLSEAEEKLLRDLIGGDWKKHVRILKYIDGNEFMEVMNKSFMGCVDFMSDGGFFFGSDRQQAEAWLGKHHLTIGTSLFKGKRW